MFRVLCVVAVLTCASDGHKHTWAAAPTSPEAASHPVAVTPAGAIRGSWMSTRRGRRIQGFRGVRYAQPPVGRLRFEPPVLITKYENEVDATEDGPACPQSKRSGYPMDEDCLRLNVYTPGTTGNEPLPVIVFFHPGGYYSVSGRSDSAGPDYMLDKDVVLVTTNYRLASLGFLSTGDSVAPGNNGLKDQVAALRWVQSNIAAFGGDPGRVTIAGYSVGSFSVMLHMVSPMSRGLFHRGISNSGSPISQIPVPSHQRHLAVKQAELLKCPTDSSKAILDCLRTKTYQEISDTTPGLFELRYDPILVWVAVEEPDFGQERFLSEQPLATVRSGNFSAVPYIISQTKDEFFWKAFYVLQNDTLRNTMDKEWYRIAPISFILKEPSKEAADRLREFYLDGKPLADDKATADGLGKLYNDAVIGFGVHRNAKLMARYSSQPTWYYEFAYIGNHSYHEDPVSKKPTGAAHHDDLIYLFSINRTFPLIEVSDSEDSKMVDKMTGLWYNIAAYGDPNPREGDEALSSLRWPKMTPSERQYLRIDKEFSVHSNLFEDRFKVWEELYPLPDETTTA